MNENVFVSFEVLTGVLIGFKFFWGMEPCQFVNSHWCIWRVCGSGLPTSWRKFLQSISHCFEINMVSYPRWLWSSKIYVVCTGNFVY